MRGGSDGGYGWTADYFAGDQPTGKTFASTVNGPVRQDLTTTFEAGTEYTLSMQIFSAGNYGPSQDGAILWSLALTALDPGDQSVRVVAMDHWFSDELRHDG